MGRMGREGGRMRRLNTLYMSHSLTGEKVRGTFSVNNTRKKYKHTRVYTIYSTVHVCML